MDKTEDKIESILAHHGVKGQKWGVITKGRSLVSGSSKRTKRRAKGESVHSMSKRLTDDELKLRISRLELEKKYRDLSKDSTINGRKFANELITSSGKTAVGALVGGVTGHIVRKALTKG